MRIGFISIAFLLVSLQMLLALPANSQKIGSVEVRLELRNETLLSAFKKIEQQTPFRFVYRKGELMTLPSKNISQSTYTVEQVLNMLLENTHLSYKQVDNNVLIQSNNNKPVKQIKTQENINFVADILIRGQVTDSKGETLPGVSIKIKGTNTGATTDLDGKYSINVPDNGSVLVFTYIGYNTQELVVGDRTTINIQLETANTVLNEVVVTALGISRESKSLTYSAQNVKGEELTKATGTNVVNALQGKVAGMTITRGSGGVGGGSTVLLRGNRSITGNNAPLYVTDGVPGSIGIEDGDNIESITVLKGAAAAALYGSAGQNGVILITTKRGKAGTTSVDFNGGVLFDQADIHTELQSEYAQGDAGIYVPSSEHSYGPKM
ncbi:MAG: carboxypeptidase-like regulatory domain-containing protein, partial [Daejeonella sp.]|nr:carboxypeptidase-like regulatory domain-containing protein [Daejeonella sp.]